MSFGARFDLGNHCFFACLFSAVFFPLPPLSFAALFEPCSIMAGIEEFVAAPCEDFLDRCTKDQLLKVADEYDLDLSGLGDKRRKDTVKSAVKLQLVEKGVLVTGQQKTGQPVTVPLGVFPGNLTFEQQKELMSLQISFEKEKQELELEKQKMDMEKHKLEADKQVEIERLRRETEQAKTDLQNTRLTLVKEGKLSGDVLLDEGRSSLSSPDMVSNLRLLPKFNEEDPDVFSFSLFERVAEAGKWSDSERILLLQCVLCGRAQEAYASLGSDSLTYKSVKDCAVLKAYELVPEAYRQRFRTPEKKVARSHLEFVREITNHFNRWCVASGVNNFEGLCDLIILEQAGMCVIIVRSLVIGR